MLLDLQGEGSKKLNETGGLFAAVLRSLELSLKYGDDRAEKGNEEVADLMPVVGKHGTGVFGVLFKLIFRSYITCIGFFCFFHGMNVRCKGFLGILFLFRCFFRHFRRRRRIHRFFDDRICHGGFQFFFLVIQIVLRSFEQRSIVITGSFRRFLIFLVFIRLLGCFLCLIFFFV